MALASLDAPAQTIALHELEQMGNYESASTYLSKSGKFFIVDTYLPTLSSGKATEGSES